MGNVLRDLEPQRRDQAKKRLNRYIEILFESSGYADSKEARRHFCRLKRREIAQRLKRSGLRSREIQNLLGISSDVFGQGPLVRYIPLENRLENPIADMRNHPRRNVTMQALYFIALELEQKANAIATNRRAMEA